MPDSDSDDDVAEPFGGTGILTITSAATMLTVEEQALDKLQDLLAIETAKASLEIDDQQSGGEFRVMQRSSDRLRQSLEAVLLVIMLLSRRKAASQARLQFDEAMRLLRTYGIPTSVMRLREATQMRIDLVKAAMVAESLSRRWRFYGQVEITAVRRAVERGGDGTGFLPRMSDTVRKSTKSLGSNIRATAATETSMAFSSEHKLQVDAAIRGSGDGVQQPLLHMLFKRWVTILDRNSCMRCYRHNNEVVRADRPFMNRDVPGLMHPNCRCQEIIALRNADIELAHAVTMAVSGPFLGYGFEGFDADEGNYVFENWQGWTPERRQAWVDLMEKVRKDAALRSRLATPEIRKSLAEAKAQVEAERATEAAWLALQKLMQVKASR
jgi:hypothetical protein